VLWGCPVIVAQNTAVSDTYRDIGDSIGRYSGILIPGIGGIDRKTAPPLQTCTRYQRSRTESAFRARSACWARWSAGSRPRQKAGGGPFGSSRGCARLCS
jgi:hypothetical protein